MRKFQLKWNWSWSPRPRIHFAIVLTVTSLATLLSIASFSYSIIQIRQNPIVEGIVVQSIPGGNGLQTPIIEYNSPLKGRTSFKSRHSSSPQSYSVGDKVQVILVGRDFEPKLKNFFSVYGLSAFLLFFASISAIGSAAVYHFRIKG